MPIQMKAKVKAKAKNITQQYISPYKWEYIFGGIFVLLILFSEMYSDFLVTFRDGINFWYALFEGHPLSFYSYARSIAGATPNRFVICGAQYDFTIYFFFAVWNFPAWLYERISGNYAESCFLFLAWGKLLFPVLAVIIARGMKKILEFITGSDEDAAAMIYAYSFSGILLMGAYFIGQYDIIGVLFAVYGLYYYLKKDYKRFYLYFGAAVSCKYFALILFVCLVLFYEKRILYVIRDIAAGFYLVVIEKFLFAFGKSYDSIHAAVTEAAAAQSAGMQRVSAEIVGVGLLPSRISYLFHLKTGMGVDVLSVFMLLLGLIWVYCYLQKREETYQFYYKVIYIAFCIYAVFILYTASTPYWAVLMVPYLFLMIYCRADNRKINLLLETVGVGSFIIWHFAREPYFFVSENCEGTLLYYLLGSPYFYRGGLSSILNKLSEEGGILFSPVNLIRSVFYVCMLILLIINLPCFQKKEKFVQEPEEPGMRGLLAFRTVCVVGALTLPLVVYVIQVVFADFIGNYQTENHIWKEILTLLMD